MRTCCAKDLVWDFHFEKVRLLDPSGLIFPKRGLELPLVFQGFVLGSKPAEVGSICAVEKMV